MLQLAEADVRQIHVSVVKPLLSKRLAETIESNDFTAQVRTFSFVFCFGASFLLPTPRTVDLARGLQACAFMSVVPSWQECWQSKSGHAWCPAFFVVWTDVW